jgi:RHS repeat-associated protein
MEGRFTTGDDYRYGFNGMESDDEVKGNNNSYDFGARMYDNRVGRWFAIDPLASKYPSLSPYVFAGNTPILAIDPNGKEIVIVGSPEFIRRVKTHLAKIQATEVGAKMIEYLHSNPYKITVAEGDGDLGNSGYDPKTGVLYIGTNSSSARGDGVPFDEFITLAHELDHARYHGEKYNFKYLSDEEQDEARYYFELNAVKFENYIRDAYGWFWRRHKYRARSGTLFRNKFKNRKDYNPNFEEVEVLDIRLDKWELKKVPLGEDPPIGSERDGTQQYVYIWVETTPSVTYEKTDKNSQDTPQTKTTPLNEYNSDETNTKARIP